MPPSVPLRGSCHFDPRAGAWVVRVSGGRHIVREREFWIDHGKIEYVELRLEEMKD